ncbi:MAG: ATP-binding cassette domain-containing protein, partial [Deltaproteobacteria bacterium]|nr:ATP-binding cassette domain-containing protein [Deltaproteobacteria bacterium]
GFLTPTSGTAVVGGEDIVRSSLAARKKLGYLPENAPVYPDMTVTGFLDFVAEIRGLTGATRKKRVAEIIEQCFLSEVRFQTINTLSKGFKQRVCFAQSIIHDPEYLIMDEPTDGLDPNQKHEVRAMIRQMARAKTIILSTHILEEVEAVCSRAIIIAHGKILADDTPAGLRRRSPLHGSVCFTVETAQKELTLQRLQEASAIKMVQVLNEEEKMLQARVYPQDAALPVVDLVAEIITGTGGKLQSFRVEEGRLDEVFRLITQEASGEERK